MGKGVFRLIWNKFAEPTSGLTGPFYNNQRVLERGNFLSSSVLPSRELNTESKTRAVTMTLQESVAEKTFIK
jgi:hypothetical protein